MKKLLSLAAALFLFCAALPALAAEVNVYTAVEPDVLIRYERAFNKRHPDIKINWVRDSAGPITARLLAEKDDPRADVVFGTALNSILELASYGIFQPYRSVNYDQINPEMRDNSPEPVWIGFNAWAASICVNKKLLEAQKIAAPTSWEDLLRPEYRGKIIMPNPASSSTGYMIIAGWIQGMGEEKAWAFMRELHKNIKMYVHSGSKPAQMAAQGEILVGISSDAFASPYVKRGAPLLLVNPSDGVAWDMEASAILKGAKNLESAKKVIDFSTSEAAAAIAVENLYIPARKVTGDNKVRSLKGMIPMNFKDAAARRSRVLEEWRSVFGQ
ncbi:extracellular solute-binding protein [Desulfovibrio sp. OttesenSCG-928-C14]|nr:extracellular solute-binding protein [Desulfovibrio sp. OttesenSCG-928-C14]